MCTVVCESHNDLEVKDDVISVDIDSSPFIAVDHSRLSEVSFAMQVITLYLQHHPTAT